MESLTDLGFFKFTSLAGNTGVTEQNGRQRLLSSRIPESKMFSFVCSRAAGLLSYRSTMCQSSKVIMTIARNWEQSSKCFLSQRIALHPISLKRRCYHGTYSNGIRQGIHDTGEDLREQFNSDDGGGYNDSGGGGGGYGGNDSDGDWESNDWFAQAKSLFFLLFELISRESKHANHIVVVTSIVAAFVHIVLNCSANAYAHNVVCPVKAPNNELIDKKKDNHDILADSAMEKSKENDSDNGDEYVDAVFQVKGGSWTRMIIDQEKDEFVTDPVKESEHSKFDTDKHMNGMPQFSHDWRLKSFLKKIYDYVRNVMLPEGYPTSVTSDYLEYTVWRMGQGIASQINGVLTTQALLYAVGLGKGAIPTAAAINWVLKDGIGYLSKIVLAKYGRHFDVQPKGWRLLADLIENAANGVELITPVYPHLFVYLGAAAGAGRSAAGLIQAATRSCFCAGFAAQRNLADVVAKAEAQGMVSKSLGIMLGIALSRYAGPSGPILLATFMAVSGTHMFCNLKSYQAVQLRTLNPYRASLVFGEYIRSGVIPSIEEVNGEEPIFTGIKFKLRGNKDMNLKLLSSQTKEDAAAIANKLIVGVSFVHAIQSQKEANVLFKLYQHEQYILVERQNSYQVLLKVEATSHDLLKVMLQVCYLQQLQTGSKAGPYNRIETSYKLMTNTYHALFKELTSSGWILTDGLVSRPQPYRLVQALN